MTLTTILPLMDVLARAAFRAWAKKKSAKRIEVAVTACHKLGQKNRNGNIGVVEVKKAIIGAK